MPFESFTTRVCLNLLDRQNQVLGSIATDAGIPKSDFVRRCLDYCLTETRFNEIVPACSGQMGGLLR
jgi:hypothetical protein